MFSSPEARRDDNPVDAWKFCRASADYNARKYMLFYSKVKRKISAKQIKMNKNDATHTYVVCNFFLTF